MACGEIWTAVNLGDLPAAEEERLRGGDRKIEACLIVETLRQSEAESVAADLSTRFPAGIVGIYRLLCEVRAARAITPRPSPP